MWEWVQIERPCRERRSAGSRLRAWSAPLVLILLAILLAGCASAPYGTTDWAPEPHGANGLTLVAQAKGERLLLSTLGGTVDFVPGVNLGATIPGRSPGELAVSAQEYARWFSQMSSLGLRAVRIYTIHPPAFYEQLVAFNEAHPDKPLYLVQGVWIPEEQFLACRDLFDPAVRAGFRQEISDAVAAVHGELRRAQQAGHAWGDWTADASPWVYAYCLGVEWDPVAIKASDDKNAGRAGQQGTYFSPVTSASPTEVWLAEMLDHTATEEARRGRSVPLTFTNWPTTDPLTHPDEPLANEDLVGVDANHITVSKAWPAGYFASYHVYPYYPDFQRREAGLKETQYGGRSDPYAGYLSALKRHHNGIPVMVTEFGMPSSVGMAHTGPLGRNQGSHSEQEQMAIDAELLRMIHDLDFSGAFVFEWTDEWFKFTWNTIDFELPGDRRALWMNPWTNEEHFGLLAMDPGVRELVTIDGRDEEWATNGSQVIYEARDGVREVRATKDEGYLYLRLVLEDPEAWKNEPVTIGFDVIPGENGGLPGLRQTAPGADYAVVLGPGIQGQAYVASWNDPTRFWRLHPEGETGAPETALGAGRDVWVPQRLLTNRPLVLPATGERRPAEFADVGRLRYGTTDPAAPDFDSRAAWAAGDCLEIRLPYQAIGFSDPSSLQALRVSADGSLSTEPVTRVGIDVVLGSDVNHTRGYAWDPWQTVRWHERLKAGIDQYGRALAEVAGL